MELAKRLGANGRRAYANTKLKIQAEAVVRVLSHDPQETREVAQIGQSEESLALIAAQVQALTRG